MILFATSSHIILQRPHLEIPRLQRRDRLHRSKAQYLLFTGKMRPDGGWPAWTCEGIVTLTLGGKVRMQREWRAEVR